METEVPGFSPASNLWAQQRVSKYLLQSHEHIVTSLAHRSPWLHLKLSVGHSCWLSYPWCLKGTGWGGRAGPALAMWRGHTKESRGQGVSRACGPLLPPFRLGWDPSPAITISTSFCCMLYMDIFISCLKMLCSCGLPQKWLFRWLCQADGSPSTISLLSLKQEVPLLGPA